MEQYVVNGETTFAQVPSERYSYTITVKGDHIGISLEKLSSRKEWSTSDLALGDYVTANNAIAGASVGDYVKLFQRTFDAGLNDTADISRNLIKVDSRTRCLELVVNIYAVGSAWKATYVPLLEERLAIVEAKLQDLDKKLEAYPVTPLCLEATTKLAGHKLIWKSFESDHFKVITGTGAIEVLIPGLYSISDELPQLSTWTVHQQHRQPVVFEDCPSVG
ncbi:hypothetical protein PHYPSEUDO_001918 [Phytophthora pseudosyringae]|uniref:Uncharacterized protein n=1 Tax=Phytophthora pseudosyringae TaxID=221518 RepID=A0A8T1WG91_9STRA|nr:hypothetical protein PHYPSEUDO_001918 [Phytophthora pseudosyringae]